MQRKVPIMDIATTLGECVNVLDNGPLTESNFNTFYTEFSEPCRVDITKQLNFRLKHPTEATFKFVLAGHRGIGKSTELLRVSKLCPEYETIFINVSDSQGDENVLYTSLLIHITDCIMQFGIEKSLISSNDAALDPLIDYWNTEIQYSEIVSTAKARSKNASAELKMNAKASSKFDLLKMLKIALGLGMKADMGISYNQTHSTTVDEIINQTISRRNSLYIKALNVLVDKIKHGLVGKRLLLIVQELDREAYAKLAENVFKDNIDAFLNINVDTIYTYPVHLLYDPAYAHIRDKVTAIYQLGVIEIINEDRSYTQGGINSLKKLVYKRIKPELIDDYALELAIKMSGGLIRDLFNIIINAATIAGTEDRLSISMNDVKSAIEILEDSYIRFLKPYDAFKKLENIAITPYHQISDDLRDFLRAECVLEYRRSRYVVHPVVIKFLHRIGQRVIEYDY